MKELWMLGVAAALLSASGASIAGTTSYQYDDAGRLRKTQFPDGKISNYVLDAAGNRQQVTPDPAAVVSPNSNDPRAFPLAAILSLLLN